MIEAKVPVHQDCKELQVVLREPMKDVGGVTADAAEELEDLGALALAFRNLWFDGLQEENKSL